MQDHAMASVYLAKIAADSVWFRTSYPHIRNAEGLCQMLYGKELIMCFELGCIVHGRQRSSKVQGSTK